MTASKAEWAPLTDEERKAVNAYYAKPVKQVFTADENVCLWANGTWCFKSSIEEYSWMSDDYAVITPDSQEFQDLIHAEHS